MKRRTLLQSAGVATFAATAGCIDLGLDTDEVTETVTDSVAASAGTTVSVVNQNGPVTVEPGDGDSVEVEAVKRSRDGEEGLDRVSIDVSSSDESVSVRAVWDDQSVFDQIRVAVDLTVTLPDGVVLERVETANGDATARDVAGDAVVRTSNGEAVADGVDGFVTLRSSNGDVEGTDVAGLDGASTSNGTVKADVSAIRGETKATSSNGSVTLSVAPDLRADVELDTSNGDVDVDDDVAVEVETRKDDRLVGTLNGGGDRLYGHTSNGDVRLQSL